MTTNFDDIRPYTDEEIPAAMQRIVKSNFFGLLCTYVYPDRNPADIRQMMLSFRTIRDFQLEVMRCVNEQVIARSITNFTYSGVQQLDPAKQYLFVSNHRDIMLDACLLQYILYMNGRETTEITFGANLMSSPLVTDIGKSNKMFRVERGGTMRDFYLSSRHLSDYIRYVLTQKGQSLWIAQRNGRTKDGLDQTDQGLIKMFCLSHPSDKIRALSELNIVPVCVSYEWEPCDVLKALGKLADQPGKPALDLLAGHLIAVIQRTFVQLAPARGVQIEPGDAVLGVDAQYARPERRDFGVRPSGVPEGDGAHVHQIPVVWRALERQTPSARYSKKIDSSLRIASSASS